MLYMLLLMNHPPPVLEIAQKLDELLVLVRLVRQNALHVPDVLCPVTSRHQIMLVVVNMHLLFVGAQWRWSRVTPVPPGPDCSLQTRGSNREHQQKTNI
jgi:hypothetical protein